MGTVEVEAAPHRARGIPACLHAYNDCTGLPPVRVENIWRQVVVVYRGGILAY